jgi:peroxiredoxin
MYGRPAMVAVFLLFSLVALAGCNRGQNPSNLGRPAPNFAIHDGTQTATLDQYRGRVLLLNFWASWCAPCIQEMPSLMALHQRLPKLAILGVSIDQDQQAYDNFLVKYRVDFPTIRDPSAAVMHRFGTRQIPESYVIGPHGHILRKYVSSQDWTTPAIVDTLQAILKQKE